VATIEDRARGALGGSVDANRPAERDERRVREERILDTATALMVRWGYRKTTIDDVAREYGVGKGTIYLHWKDKNELFRAAIRRANLQVTEDLKQRIAADPEGGLPHRAWMHSMRAALTHPPVAAMIKIQVEIAQGLLDAYDQATLTHWWVTPIATLPRCNRPA
jgi:AcrR family transcriptional regulator